METRNMDNNTPWVGTGNVLMTAGTIFLTFISQFKISDLAAWAAVFAGLTTAGLNIYKFIQMRKRKEDE